MAKTSTPTHDTHEPVQDDRASPSTGQTEHNKAGHQPLTPRNEPRRTPESRHDRESHVGSGNQHQARRGGGMP